MNFKEYVNESYSRSAGINKLEERMFGLEKQLDPKSVIPRKIIEEFGKGYEKDFKEMHDHVKAIIDIWEDISQEISLK